MNTTKVWKYMLLACLFMLVAPAQAQRFFNLTSSEVRVDSVLPRFVYSIPLTGAYRDSVYTVSWDLTSDSGTPLGTGVYLYRVKVASDGSSYTSKVKKLIIIK